MASSSETGHSKNITTFETLILTCTGYGADYIPSNTDLALTNLTAQHLDCKQSVKDVKTAEAPFNDVEGQRQLIFKPLKPTSTKVLNALKGAKAPATVIADAETLNRKIQGKRADNSPPTTVDSTPPNSISVSQQSYDMQIDNFEKLIELADIEPKYNPNEVPLKIVTLQAYHGQLETINTTVKNTYIPYKNAMNARDFKLYNPETGLVETSKLVKAYVKSAFGASSPQYKQISGLKFTIIKS